MRVLRLVESSCTVVKTEFVKAKTKKKKQNNIYKLYTACTRPSGYRAKKVAHLKENAKLRIGFRHVSVKGL